MKVIDKFGNTKTNLVGSSTWGAITGTLSDQTDLQTALDAKQNKSVEVTGSLTAANDAFYIATATATFTDPTPAQAKGFVVYVRNGTSTIGGTAYVAGSYVLRYYHSGSWNNKNLDPSSLPIGITIGTTTITGGTSGRVLYNNAGVVGEVVVDTSPTNGSTNPIDSNAVFDALALKQNLLYRSITTTPSSTLTGTITETQLLRIEITGDELSASEILKNAATLIRSGNNGTITIRLKMSTSSTMPTGTTDQIGLYTYTINQQWAKMRRSMTIEGGNITTLAVNNSALTDETLINLAPASKAHDHTISNFLYISATLSNTADSIYLLNNELTN